jgi:hypothetical protein
MLLVLSAGCATTKAPTIYMDSGPVVEDPADKDNWQPNLNGMGWHSMLPSGHLWVYRTERGIQASCNYQYSKVRGVEQWRGKMLKMKTSFWQETEIVQRGGLENLSGCVEWVEHHLKGGYWI